MSKKKSMGMIDASAENGKPSETDGKKVEQYDPAGAAIKQSKDDIVTGVDYVVSVYEPQVVVDCHMHVMSGNCSPLQLVWDRTLKVKSRLLGRKFLMGFGENIGKVADAFSVKAAYVPKPGTGGEELVRRKHWLRESSAEAKKTTLQICDDFINDRQTDIFKYLSKEALYKSKNENRQGEKTGSAASPLVICLPLTMDMEFAHLLGYFGLNIYNGIYEEGNWDKPVHYWTPDPESVEDLIQNKRVFSIPKVRTDKQTEDQFKESKKEYKHDGIPGLYIDDKGQRIRITVNAEPFLLPDSETDLYERWKDQQTNMKLAMVKHPLKIFPLYHYDPRRWQVEVTGNAYPFSQVTGSGLYIGFKIYTAQGYRPWDANRLPILKQFYAYCRNNRIPIVNHCTPQGAYTYDRKHYIDFLHPADDEHAEHLRLTSVPLSTPSMENPLGTALGSMANPNKLQAKPPVRKDAVEYFNEEFVSPNAWREVLKQNILGVRLHSLRICLAHFGGGTDLGLRWFNDIVALMKDYPNVYADISSSLADPKCKDKFKAHFKDWYNKEMKSSGSEIRKRILFGTDWYMTLMDGVDYMQYFTDARDFMDSFDNELWFQLTQVNPYRFFRFDEQVDRIRDNLIKTRETDKEVKREFDRPYTEKNLDEINRDATLIRSANEPYVRYQEGR